MRFSTVEHHGNKNRDLRSSLVKEFESPHSPVKIFILTPEAGGVGLNLPSAKHVFNLASWWNSSQGEQMQARALRAGKTELTKIYHFNFGTVQELHKNFTALVKDKWQAAYLSKGSFQEASAKLLEAIAADYLNVSLGNTDTETTENALNEKKGQILSLLETIHEAVMGYIEEPLEKIGMTITEEPDAVMEPIPNPIEMPQIVNRTQERVNALVPAMATPAESISSPSLTNREITVQVPPPSKPPSAFALTPVEFVSLPRKLGMDQVEYQLIPLAVSTEEQAKTFAHVLQQSSGRTISDLLGILNKFSSADWNSLTLNPVDFIKNDDRLGILKHPNKPSVQGNKEVRWLKQVGSNGLKLMNEKAKDIPGAPRVLQIAPNKFASLIKLEKR
jgi:Helicase conserved C-terminal domain